MERNKQEIQAIISKKYRKSEQSLNLGNCGDLWMHVIESGDWRMLHVLNLTNCKIVDANFVTITQKSWPFLHKLLLWNNKITHEGIKQLLPKKWLNLQNLDLESNSIGSKGAKLLIKVSFPRLEQLKLSNIQNNIGECGLGTEGMKYLSKGKWNKLTSLYIKKNKFGLDGYEAITEANWWKLSQLSLGDFKDWQYNEENIHQLALIANILFFVSITNTYIPNDQVGVYMENIRRIVLGRKKI